ncbi:hypothetical protein F8566_22180 [Actinomadura rudentiformis]|uniref:Uncharacterized protein n=1 Tax=Actinomadura rudentiformis TaxID=359158 RepID=A0A6H9YKM9_9ACTN|nr:hypothetical protein F8566_22180 [Actinomadura rudentiformis]
MNSLSKRPRGMAWSPRRAVLRRSIRWAGLVSRTSWRCAHVANKASAGRCRFQVAAAAVSHRSITAAKYSGVTSATGLAPPGKGTTDTTGLPG